MNKTLFLLLIIILCITPVLAVPPFQQSSSSLGYDIEVLVLDSLKQNSAHKFHIHVYNSTSGYPIITGIGCYLHLYNSTGSHLVKGYDDTISDGFDYSFTIDGENFTQIGQYAFVIQCNGSGVGGYHAGGIEITTTGTNHEQEWLSIILIITFGIILFYLCYSLLYLIGHFAQLNFDLHDLGKYIGVLSIVYLHNYLLTIYYPSAFLIGFSNTILVIAVFTHGFIAGLAFLISWMVSSMIKKRIADSGVLE